MQEFGKGRPVFFRRINFGNDLLRLLEKSDLLSQRNRKELEIHALDFIGKHYRRAVGPSCLVAFEQKSPDVPPLLNDVDLEVLRTLDQLGPCLELEGSLDKIGPGKLDAATDKRRLIISRGHGEDLAFENNGVPPSGHAEILGYKRGDDALVGR